MTEDKILQWANDKGIIEKGTVLSQLGKLKEEVLELEQALDSESIEAVLTELGDVLVVSTIIAHLLAADLETCLALAHTKNSKRKGIMRDGVFVKEGDI